MRPTVARSLYSEEATVDDKAPAPSVDSNLKRSSASEFTFTDGESGKRSCHKRNHKDENSILKATFPKI